MFGKSLTQRAAFLGILVAAIGSTAAEPPDLNISETSLRGSLSPSDVVQIRTRIAYRFNALLQADKEKPLLAARDAILEDFRKYNNAEYRYIFAREAANRATQILSQPLEVNDPLRHSKEVNLSIAISQLSQVTIQPALEVLVRHPNPAVRYLGWQGYRNVRSLLLAQSGQAERTLFDTLRRRAGDEDSPAVIGGILETLNIPSAGTAAVSPEALRQAQKIAFDILHKNWDAYCRRVLKGNAEMAEAARKGFSALQNYSQIFADDPETLRAILQMLADMTWCSAKVYDLAKTKGLLADVNVLLLLNGEEALNDVTDQQKMDIQSALTNPRTIDRGAAVRLAVLNWIDELKPRGVQKPDFAPAADTMPSAPATGPAT